MADHPAAASWWPRRLGFAVMAAVVVPVLTTPPAEAATVDIAIGGFAFSPASAPMQLAGGEPGYSAPHVHVAFSMNDQGTEHTVTFDDPGLVSSEHLAPGQRYEVVIFKPGSFTYRCSIHPTMRGTLVVSPAAVAPSTTAPAPDAAPSAGPDRPAATPAASGSGSVLAPVLAGLVALGAIAAVVGYVVARRRRPRSRPEG